MNLGFLRTTLIGLTTLSSLACSTGDSDPSPGGAGAAGGASSVPSGMGMGANPGAGATGNDSQGTAGGGVSDGAGASGAMSNTGGAGAGAQPGECNLDPDPELVCELVDAECSTVELPGISNTDAMEIDGAALIYFYGDGCSTMCQDTSTPGKICLSGTVDDAQTDYSHWGAGIGLQMSETDAEGNVTKPFDAAAQGVVGFRFNITGTSAATPVRVQLGMVPVGARDPRIDFEKNAFLWGTDAAKDIKADGVVTVMFDELALPSWTELDVDCDGTPDDVPFDRMKIHSLQFQVVTSPGDPVPYSVCVDSIEWLGADDNVVDLAQAMPPAGGEDVGAGGAGGAPMGMAGAGGMMMGGAGGAATGGAGTGGAGGAADGGMGGAESGAAGEGGASAGGAGVGGASAGGAGVGGGDVGGAGVQ